MPALESFNPHLPDHRKGQVGTLALLSASYQASVVADTLVDQAHGQFHDEQTHVRDPFSCYQAYQGHDSCPDICASTHDQEIATEAIRVEAQPTLEIGGSQQCTARSVPSNLALRVTHRSGGGPLATIVEQGSLSTLNSHKSMLSADRFPMTRVAENASPKDTTPRCSKSLDNQTMVGDGEGGDQNGQIHASKNAACEKMHKRTTCGGSQSFGAIHEPSLGSVHGRKSLRESLRDILRNIRHGTGSRSWSSSTVSNATSHSRNEVRDTRDSSPTSSDKDYQGQLSQQLFDGSSPGGNPQLGLFLSPAANTGEQLVHHGGSDVDLNLPACIYPPFAQSPLHAEVTEDLGSYPNISLHSMLKLPSLQHAKEWVSSSSLVSPKLGDRAEDRIHVETAALGTDNRVSFPAQDVPDNVPVYKDAPSPQECDVRARYTSRNVGSCGTMSTSYSGTVLGVDLDLQQEFSHYSRNSVTPVWYAPEESGSSELQGSQKRNRQQETNPLPPRSLTSCALSALLPIAASEGIVQPDFTTPQLSFFSPSGNVIQVEKSYRTVPSGILCPNWLHSSSLSKDTTYQGHSKVSTIHKGLSAFLDVLPTRLATMPVASPSQSLAPLPEHLRHHHNYQHAETGQNTPKAGPDSEIYIDPAPTVRGCGGMIRTNSLNPRSGPRNDADHSSEDRHSISYLFDSQKFESRCDAFVSWTASHVSKALTKHSPAKKPEDRIGPLAGHAIRICFCQPWDGAAVETCSCSTTNRDNGVAFARSMRDTATPNFRTVEKAVGGKTEKTRRSHGPFVRGTRTNGP